MNLLIVNDDGIHAKGIHFLIEAAKTYGKVYVVAPKTQQSAVSQGITIHEPLSIDEEHLFPDVEAWSISGKPADCVKVALEYLRLPIDVVLSGVNDGPNLGTDILYSGTVAAATEACVFNIPSIALSTDFGSWDVVENELAALLHYIFANDLPKEGIVLNVNFQLREFKHSQGILFTRQGQRIFSAKFRHDNGQYWQEGDWVPTENKDDTDVHAVSHGFISITPLQLDRTSDKYLNMKKEG